MQWRAKTSGTLSFCATPGEKKRALEFGLPERCCTCASRSVRVPVRVQGHCAAVTTCRSVVEATFLPTAFAPAKLESPSLRERDWSFRGGSEQTQLCRPGRPRGSSARRTTVAAGRSAG